MSVIHETDVDNFARYEKDMSLRPNLLEKISIFACFILFYLVLAFK